MPCRDERNFFWPRTLFSWLKKGFVRFVLQTSRKRDAKMPDVPTLFELMDKEKTRRAAGFSPT